MRKSSPSFSIRSIGLLCLMAVLLALPQLAAAATPSLVKSFAYNGPGGQTSTATINGTLYFVADDGVTGYELWKSDGTAAGTVLVKDINPGSNSSGPQNLINFNDTLYFTADDGTHGQELWKSDGTSNGTVLVKDINPEVNVSSSPQSLTNFNGTLYFSANDGTNGSQIWKTDGTLDGTVRITNLAGGANSCFASNGTLYVPSTYELWKSDGTDTGTVMVKAFVLKMVFNVVSANGITYLMTYDYVVSKYELWTTDGTEAGTVLLITSAPNSGFGNLTSVNSTLFFNFDDGIHGNELWKSDGTVSGTMMVKDINPNNSDAWSGDSMSGLYTNVNGTLYFNAYDGNSWGLWKSDGTANGTIKVNFGDGFTRPDVMINVNNTLYFESRGMPDNLQLWKSDGTDAGTVFMGNLSLGHYMPGPDQLFANANGTFFSMSEGYNNGCTYDLYVLDITPPAAAITSPAEGAPLSGATVNISGSASDDFSGVQLVEVSTDNGATWNTAGDFSGNSSWSSWLYIWPLPQTSASHTLIARSTDKAGNISTSVPVSVTTAADLAAPTTTATPAGGAYSSAQNVSLTCSDGSGSGCATTYYCLGSGCTNYTAYNYALGTSMQGPPLISIPVSSSNVLRYYSVDVAGNPETVKTETYTITSAATKSILWRNPTTASPVIWAMNGATRLSSSILPSLSSGWTVAGVADFDGDGKPDILWRNPATASPVIWFMNSDGTQKGSVILPSLSSGWSVAGVADFDGDGTPDILWRNPTTASPVIWFMNRNGTQKGSVILPSLSSGWTVAGVSDFDGDGTPDILWRNPTTASPVIWFMNSNGTQKGSVILPSLSSGWSVAGIADFDGDGKPDILWRHSTTLTPVIWYMNSNGTQKGSVILPSLSSGWIVAGIADFDADNKPDILWRNPASDSPVIWFMNSDGTKKSSGILPSLSAGWSVAGIM